MDNHGLDDIMSFTNEELEEIRQPIRTGECKSFNPNLTLNKLEDGFRIFAFNEFLNEIPACRSIHAGQQPSLQTVFLEPHIVRAGQSNAEIRLSILSVVNDH